MAIWASVMLMALLLGCGTLPRPNRLDNPGAPGAAMVVGWTHERWSPDRLNDPAQTAAATLLLSAAAPLQNAQILGWGMPSPQPAPGREDFAALDARVALMSKTARWPVITLCCAPEWMKALAPGADERTRFEQAPARERFADFAALAARIAQRYPQVRHFMVWNEMKGFWDSKRQAWDAAAYTELYNQVFRAIKAVRPDALVGGPYVVLDSYPVGSAEAAQFGSLVSGRWGTVDRRALAVVEHWLANKIGADFLVVDGGVVPARGELDVPPLQALEKFTVAQQWLRSKTNLPLWWAEFYPSPGTLRGAAAVLQIEQALARVEAGGAAAVLFWNPACRADAGYGQEACLWRQDAATHDLHETALARLLSERAATVRATAR